MNGHDFIIFYEQFALYKLAEYYKIDIRLIKHISKHDPDSYYDLEFNSKRYDVKVSNPVIVQSGKQAIWDFDLRQTVQTAGKNRKRDRNIFCDFYILIGMLRGIPNKIFLIPIDQTPKHHIRISIKGNSKYYKYLI